MSQKSRGKIWACARQREGPLGIFRESGGPRKSQVDAYHKKQKEKFSFIKKKRANDLTTPALDSFNALRGGAKGSFDPPSPLTPREASSRCRFFTCCLRLGRAGEEGSQPSPPARRHRPPPPRRPAIVATTVSPFLSCRERERERVVEGGEGSALSGRSGPLRPDSVPPEVGGARGRAGSPPRPGFVDGKPPYARGGGTDRGRRGGSALPRPVRPPLRQIPPRQRWGR